MQSILKYLVLLLILFFLAACSGNTSTLRTQTPASTAEEDPFFLSKGGGEPRSTGYWLLWNSCALDNKAEIAANNGGRAAGWFILDDIIEDPGILLGELQVGTCEEGINLLQELDLYGAERGSDAAYQLAAQLLAAQLNLAAGSEYCQAVNEAISGGQLLLIGLSFDGEGSYLGPQMGGQDLEAAVVFKDQLEEYNGGGLCK